MLGTNVIPKNEWRSRYCDKCIDLLENSMTPKVFSFHVKAGDLPKVMTKASCVNTGGVRFLCKKHYENS